MSDIRYADASNTLLTASFSNVESVLATTPLLPIPADTVKVCVIAWCQVASSVAPQTYTMRIRRGASVAGTQVALSATENTKVNATGVESLIFCTTFTLQSAAQEQFSFTLINGSGATITVAAATIFAFII